LRLSYHIYGQNTVKTSYWNFQMENAWNVLVEIFNSTAWPRW